MNRTRWSCLGLAAAALVGLAAGCRHSSPRTRYYTLAVLAPPASAGTRAAPSLGVGPIRLARHLRQAALVRRTSTYELRYCEGHLWAEPTEDAIGRVLAANLALLTGSSRVTRHPWRPSESPERRIALDIDAFELAPDGAAELRGRWEVRDASGALLAAGPIDLRGPADGQIGNLAAALSQALLELSRALAEAACGPQ